MNLNSVVVLKLGGSLLTLPDLDERLHALVCSLSPQKVLIIAGGGAAADEIRRLDESIDRRRATQAHWDAIAAMTSNAETLSRVLGWLPIVSSRTNAQTAWQEHDAVLLSTTAFLREEQAQHARALPESWSVTSDSISAFVALHWPAAQLLLCKSCDLISAQIDRLSHEGLLDTWFPNLITPLRSAGVELQWLNLQTAGTATVPIDSLRAS